VFNIIIFRDVVECDEFLTLSFEDVIKIISCDDLNVPFEEKVGINSSCYI